MFFKKQKNFADGNIDFIIIGLGNPGKEYEATRHNAGFMAIDCIADSVGVQLKKLKFKSYIAQCDFGGKRVLLVKPQTMMNSSGEAVVDVLNFYKLDSSKMLVIFDDISLDVGTLRIKRKGTDGGHNGIKSIIYLTGKDDFPRIKIGIGAKPNPNYDLAKWVLSRFRKDDLKLIETACENACNAAKLIIDNQIDTAMNKYN